MAANSPGICVSFLQDLLNGIHAFGTTAPARTAGQQDTFYGALYGANPSSGNLTPGTTTAYSTTNELQTLAGYSGSGYTAGGIACVAQAPAKSGAGVSGNAAYWTPGGGTPGNLVWSALTCTTAFDTLLIYNHSATGKNACSLHNFGSQTITAGTLTLTMPANAQGTALIELDY
jgi:hypothetical protein